LKIFTNQEKDMKRYIVGFVFFIVCLTVSGLEDSPPAKLIDLWQETGAVSEMRVMHDFQDGAYIFYIADGEFRILRKAEGEDLSPYTPAGFDGSRIHARNLSVISEGPEQYSSFIGRKDGLEELYLFELTYRGELIYRPLEETRAVSIADYSVCSANDGSISIYTLYEHRLNCITLRKHNDNLKVFREISSPGEIVDNFELIQIRDKKINFGWYSAARGNNWEIMLFSLGEKGLLIKEKTGPYTEHPLITLDGFSGITIINEREISVYHLDGGTFNRDLRFVTPLKAQLYKNTLGTGYATGLLMGQSDGEEVVYGVDHENSGTPSFNRLFSFPKDSLIDIFFTGSNQISLLYRYDHDWYSVSISLSGGLSKVDRLKIPGEPLLLACADRGNLSRFYGLFRKSDGSACFALFQFDQGEWKRSLEKQFPDIVPTDGLQNKENSFFNPFYMKRGIIFMSSPIGVLLFETGLGGCQVIEASQYDLSIMRNRVSFLAAYSDNAIILYGIKE
jgi:hypothetical protein